MHNGWSSNLARIWHARGVLRSKTWYTSSVVVLFLINFFPKDYSGLWSCRFSPELSKPNRSQSSVHLYTQETAQNMTLNLALNMTANMTLNTALIRTFNTTLNMSWLTFCTYKSLWEELIEQRFYFQNRQKGTPNNQYFGSFVNSIESWFKKRYAF